MSVLSATQEHTLSLLNDSASYCGVPPKSGNMSQSGRPLLDNSLVSMFPVSLPGRRTCSCGIVYITDRYHGNESLNSGFSVVTNTLAAVVSENRKLNPLRWCSLLRWQRTLLRRWLTEITNS
jgi:hypothetical protein